MAPRHAIRCVVALATLLAGLAVSTNASVIITQRSGESYIAWEAEEDHEHDVKVSGRAWSVVSDVHASGGQALEAVASTYDAPGGAVATYTLQFDTAGTYRLYFRMNAPDSSADSMFRSPAFDLEPADPPSPHLPTTTGYEWFNDDFNPQDRYVVSVGDLGNTLTLSIGTRESEFRVDRFVLSTATDLTDSQLDALMNWSVPVSYFTDEGSGSDWATEENWSAGVPADGSAAFIGEGKTAYLTTAGAITLEQLAVGHADATRPGKGTLVQSAGDVTVMKRLSVGENTTGSAVPPSTYELTGGTLTVGQETELANLYVGFNTAGPDAGSTGTLDLSGADGFTAFVDNLAVGVVTSGASGAGGSGTLTLSTEGTNTISATTITLGNYTRGGGPAVKGTVHLGFDNTIHAETIYVGRQKAQGEMTIVSGGALQLAGLSGPKADLYIGYNDNTTQSNYPEGTMDLTGGTFNATLGNLVIGYHRYPWGGSSNGSGTGELSFDAGEVTVDSVTIGSAIVQGSTGYEGRGIGTLTMGGGTFTAGSITLAAVSSRTEGTIKQSGGTLVVTGDVTSGPGASAIHVDGGTMTIDGDLKIASLAVGQNGRTASLSADGDAVIDGSGSLRVGYRSTTAVNPSDATLGTLDLAGAGSVVIATGTIDVGVRAINENTTTRGTISLPTAGTSSISAGTITVGNSGSGATPTVHGIVELGADNTIRVDTMYVGRVKAQGQMSIVSGGTLDLAGLSGNKTNLYVGYNDNNTTTDVSWGMMDLGGGTFDAALGQLVVGYHLYPWSDADAGSGTGTLSFDAGTVTADTVTIGMGSTHPTHGRQGRGVGTLNMSGGSFTAGAITLAAGSARAEGTIELSGGTLTAESITRGVGTAEFDFTGGTLHVGTFGSVESPFDLAQNGGTLAPGNSIGMTTIYGDYTMDAGTLEIEINGYDQGDQGLVGDAGDGIGYDFVMVHGNASLAGNLNVSLLDGHLPAVGDVFDVLQTTDALGIAELALSDNWPGSTFGWWEMARVPGPGDGFLLRLSAVPEPTAAMLALLGLAGVLGCVRPRRRK